MARKKQEVKLQLQVETQEEWEELLTKEGVIVVDVYQEWAGPCKAMVSNFRKLKNELGDDLLRFAIAKSDHIDSLERYRGRCQPCFLFYAGGLLVFVQRGAMVPVLMKAITSHLTKEHKVLDGTAERDEVVDPVLAEEDAQRRAMEEAEEERKRGVTIAILKPNVVKAGKVEEIIERMKEHGIEILEQEERTLTREEAETFYEHKKDEDFFDDLCDFMSSGPSVVLVLSKGETGEGIIDEWRDLLGPANVEEAREMAPDSLRAQFGEESFVNAVHGSDSDELAMQELAFFFPNYTLPGVQRAAQKHRIQRTLALIRPDALRERKDEILGKIEESGFKVAMQKELQLTREQAGEFYKEHVDQPYFEDLLTRMTNGPVLALALAREDAIAGWRDLLGPKEVDVAKEQAPQSLRAQFAVEDVEINPLHGSSSENEAQEEINYFFPMQQTLAAIKPDSYETRDDIMNKIKEAGFNIAARKETEVTRDVAEQFYADLKDKDYFDDLVQHMISGPTLFMVLSREDAVEGWRGLIGPTDPIVAKEEDPNSIRAQFGTDITANAVHGSSSIEEAKTNMQLVFGDLDFEIDGTIRDSREPTDLKCKSAAEDAAKTAEPADTAETADAAETAETADAAETAETAEIAETEQSAAEETAPATEAEEKPASPAADPETAPGPEAPAESEAAADSEVAPGPEAAADPETVPSPTAAADPEPAPADPEPAAADPEPAAADPEPAANTETPAEDAEKAQENATADEGTKSEEA